jgi:hypothetical protein
MAVMAREVWTDERLDDLNGRVASMDRRMEAGFKEVREEFRAVRAESAAQAGMLNQTMYRLFGGMIVTWIVGVIAILTQV